MKTKPKVKLVKSGLPYTIERNVPLPARILNRPIYELFAKMKKEDSFLIGHNKKDYSRIQGAAHHWGKKNKASFAFRNTEEGYRCWRIK